MSKLKPCPFCGETATLDYRVLPFGKHWFITCDCCGMMYQDVISQRKYVKGDWNTRPIEDALQARITELEEEQVILKDQMREAKNILIDKRLHIDSLYEEGYKLQKRIAELEALVERLIEAGNKLGTYFIGYTPRKKELLQREFWEAWRSAVSDWQSMTSHVTNPSDSQGIVTRNGGEG